MTPNDPRTPPPFGYGGSPSPSEMAPPPPPVDGEAKIVFALGLLGLLGCSVLAPVAWVRGAGYRTRCRAAGREPSGLGVAGWIMGQLGTGMLVVGVVGAIAMYAWGLP